MSTTRSQKRKNNQLSAEDDVSEGFVSPVEVGNHSLVRQDSNVAGPSKPKSPRVEDSFLESLRASLKEEITSEIKNLLAESQREMLKLLKPETRENVRINIDDETENETRSFYTPTKTVRITSTQNNDTNSSRNSDSKRAIAILAFLSKRALESISELNSSSSSIKSSISAS